MIDTFVSQFVYFKRSVPENNKVYTVNDVIDFRAFTLTFKETPWSFDFQRLMPVHGYTEQTIT